MEEWEGKELAGLVSAYGLVSVWGLRQENLLTLASAGYGFSGHGVSFCTATFLPGDQLLGKRSVGHCAPAQPVVGEDGEPMTGSFRQTDIAGNHTGKYFTGEMAPDLLCDLQ